MGESPSGGCQRTSGVLRKIHVSAFLRRTQNFLFNLIARKRFNVKKTIDSISKLMLISNCSRERGAPLLSVRFASIPLPRASDTRVYTLPNEISAIQIVSFDDKTPGLGPVSKLPRGARIEACGDGFDDQTLKVSHEGQF